ncbi:MAG TPA: SBBP repeat-containing protein, partial [Bacteroidales bacterium]|nr:SBBP repeat-containing protein [Bacteroidales bacterium]
NVIDSITGWTANWQTNGADSTYKFNIGTYDSTNALVIQVDEGNGNTILQSDRNLLHSTYYGGAGRDYFTDVATDAAGKVYVTGYTYGPSFPTISGIISSTNNASDALVIALQPDLLPIWTTLYGGGLPTDVGSQGTDYARSIAVDNAGNIFIGGHTQSVNLPIANPGNGAYVDSTLSGTGSYKQDMFIARLSKEDGHPIWATYLGGTTDTFLEDLWDMATDNAGNLYIVGSRQGNTPIVSLAGAYNRTYGVGYIAKFNTHDSLVWATGFGGTNGTENIKSVACDPNGNLLITGVTNSTAYPKVNFGGGAYWQPTLRGDMDAFIAKFNTSDSLIWSTYFGGDENEEGDGITTDNSGNIYVTGFSRSETNFPFYNAPTGMDIYHGPFAPFVYTDLGDVIISKFSSSCVQMVTGLYGGSAGDASSNIVVDASNRVFVTGNTESSTFPVINNSPSTLFSQNYLSNYDSVAATDAFLIYLNLNLVPLWATFYGGGSGMEGSDWGNAVAVSQNRLTMVGVTNSTSAKIPLANLNNGAYYQPSLCTYHTDDGFFAYFDLSSLPVSINEQTEIVDNLSVYPNPTDGLFNLLINTKSSTDLLLEIYNVTGSCIFKQNFKNSFGNQTMTIDLSSFSKGLYLLQLKSDDNVICKKIIIQ